MAGDAAGCANAAVADRGRYCAGGRVARFPLVGVSPMSDARPISDNIREKQVYRILHVVRWLRILPSVGRNILAGSYIITINGHIV
jgi:hypothetical protein